MIELSDQAASGYKGVAYMKTTDEYWLKKKRQGDIL